MKIPFKIRQFKKFVKWPRYIIIHDVNCEAKSFGEVKIDNATIQTNKLRGIEYAINKRPDLNYHFIVELIKDDYEVLMGRPLAVHCEYDDIPSPFDFAFHVCVMGNFNFDIPERRLYQKICYNVLSPMLRLYRLPIDRIYLHSEISSNKQKCPGEFFDKHVMLNHLRTMRLI